MPNPIIVALDVSSTEKAISLVEQVAPVVGAFKIGSELFTAAGPEIVRRIRATGSAVFLDLKFHDIPNTVAKAVASAVRLDVQMLTIHIGGGPAMMKAAEESAQKTAEQFGRPTPLVLGVTVLTSFDGNELASVGVSSTLAHQVERLAALAMKSGLRGLVCSPLELTGLRQTLPESVQLVTPGIRGPEDEAGDQKRTLSAREAMDAGANWLVIGRPIHAASEPRLAAQKILDSLK
ncbi:MAG TPA: orotidine-5'-phosphate decarboxylase [Verrucomicrobiae bacterium]|nr:orotidine-5'-phosphate decarboxylase [Verrucomicrobiae bacterium]